MNLIIQLLKINPSEGIEKNLSYEHAITIRYRICIVGNMGFFIRWINTLTLMIQHRLYIFIVICHTVNIHDNADRLLLFPSVYYYFFILCHVCWSMMGWHFLDLVQTSSSNVEIQTQTSLSFFKERNDKFLPLQSSFLQSLNDIQP